MTRSPGSIPGPLRVGCRLLCLGGLALVLSLSGCSQFVLLGLLLGGPPSIEPDFDAETGKSLTEKDIRVAVVCYAPTELQWQHPKVDAEIAATIAYRLAEHKIQAVDPDYVRAWIDQHPNWEKAEEIGRAFEVDYVIEIEIADFGLQEADSTTLLRGRTEAYINVVEMADDDTGERIFTKELDFAFPTHVPRSTYDQSLISFKREYLSRLSERIGFLFYERYNGDMIPWGS